MMTEQAKVPAIRFAGFTDPWEQRKLGDVADLLTGYPFESRHFTDTGIPLVRGMNVKRGYLDMSADICENWSDAVGVEDYLLKAGDIVIQMDGALIGSSYAMVTPENTPSLLVQRVTRVRCGNRSRYIFQAVQRGFLRYIKSLKTETAVPHLSLSDIADYAIPVPKEEREQEHIGSFFSRLDDLITLHQRKYDKLVVFKKSMLEKMFPKDGESVPEIRFAGFTDPWEQRKFSELASLRRGLTYSPADIRPYGQGIRVLRSSNIDEDEFTLSNEDVFVDETVVGIELVQEGEILITAANGSPRLVGKRAIINGLTGKTVHGGFMLCAHAEQPDYVAALMGSRWYQHFLATGVAGGNGSIGNLDKAALEDEFAFVPSIEEQELIGVLFSRLDDLITLHQRKLELLRNIKKSLLDKMFV
ncbi:restriction endonuclease subunit S [Bifidobacterium bifidum]|nr:restriction endonuclease subunit S [Bifidobacterium bifidum]MDB1249927.1 restriction endonuclease subunit S [Bifidobacterium bifidum]